MTTATFWAGGWEGLGRKQPTVGDPAEGRWWQRGWEERGAAVGFLTPERPSSNKLLGPQSSTFRSIRATLSHSGQSSQLPTPRSLPLRGTQGGSPQVSESFLWKVRGWEGWPTALTLLLQGQLALGLDVLQSGCQGAGEAARAILGEGRALERFGALGPEAQETPKGSHDGLGLSPVWGLQYPPPPSSCLHTGLRP